MGSRVLPTECPHGRVLDWGDFGPSSGNEWDEPQGCDVCEALPVEIAPHLWRVTNDHGTFVVFWWDDSEAPGSPESYVWHLQPNGCWREYGGYGGAPGEFHEGLVEFVITDRRIPKEQG